MVGRALHVAGVVATSAVAGAVGVVAARVRRRPLGDRQRQIGERLARTMERLGPSFVKLGQLLSTREDLLPRPLLAPLDRLQDAVVPARSWRAVRRSIERAVGAPLLDVFSEFDERPVASASVAHVYRARLRSTGELVAVKVRRPNVERVVAADARLVAVLGRSLERVPSFRNLPIAAALGEVSSALVQQLDLRTEAAHNRRFARLFADTPTIRLPRPLDELCSDEVLVMSFVEGLRRLDDPAIPLAAFERAAKLALHVVYRMIFTAGVIHCDLHPSNMCLGPDGELVVLDTGLVATLCEADRRRFRAFFVAIVFDDPATCSRILIDTAASTDGRFDVEAFRRDIADLVHRTSGRKAGSFSVAAFAYALFEIQRRHGLRGSTDFSMAIIALLVVEGVVRHRLRDLDFQRAAAPYLTAGIGS